jgi:hypothetical protein
MRESEIPGRRRPAAKETHFSVSLTNIKFLLSRYLTKQMWEFRAPPRDVAFATMLSGPDGNSPQFVEKAGIFCASRPQWHEAICNRGGDDNRDAL